MKRLLLAFAFLVAGIAAAAAACTSPAVMKDNASTTFNMSLATVPDGNCGSNVALPSWAGGTLGAMANYGTSPGAVLVPGVNAFITNTPAISGTVTANQGTAAAVTAPWPVYGGQAASTTMQNGATANGNGTSLTVTGYQTALVNVNCSVACSGGTTINFEGTDSTGTFFALAAFPVTGGSTAVSSATTSGQFWVPVSGLTTIRARISAYSAGTITVTGTPVFGVNASVAQVANTNANGQQTMANSSPVVIASNQSAITVNNPTAANLLASVSGASSNASSAVATGSTNVPAIAYLYGFNGTTYDQLQVDASKFLKVNVSAALPVGTNLIGKAGIDQTTPGTTNGTQDAATGSTGATAPTKSIEGGAIAQNAEATAVTNGQLKSIVSDLVGKLIVLPYANPENFLNGEITTAMTGTTSTAVTGMGAQGAGVRNYITSCSFSNSHATVGTMILLQDGSAGTTLWQQAAAPAFGGGNITFPTPIKTTANTGLFVQNVTTGSNTLLSCTGYKGI